MKKMSVIGGVIGGVSVAGAAAAAIGAKTLFDRVIPRQDQVRVDLSEMADMEQWEEYKKMMAPRKEWFLQQNVEDIEIKARDGIKLHAKYFPAEKPSDRIVIYLHGYTSTGVGEFAAKSRFYHELGFDCLVLDLRAHGESGGEYVGFGVLDRYDCLAWIDYITERFGNEKRILLHGTSMGAATALMTLGFDELPGSVKGVVSDCAFTSPYDVFAHILKRDYHMTPFPIMNINSVMCQKKAGYRFDDYSTLTALQKTDRPVLFIHGSADNFVPVWMSKKNAAACVSPSELVIVPKAGHGASYYEDSQLYEEAELRFIEKWIPENP